MKHAAIHLRVSTDARDTQSQEPDLKRWVDSQEAPVEWYEDKATGTTVNRPGWQKLEEAFRKGQVSTIVVWR